MNETYAMKGGWKWFMMIFGVFAMPIFLLGLPLILLAIKGEARLTDEGFAFWWLGTKTIPFSAVESIRKAPAANLLGAAMGPLWIQTSLRKRPFTYPSNCFAGRDEILAAFRQHSSGAIEV